MDQVDYYQNVRTKLNLIPVLSKQYFSLKFNKTNLEKPEQKKRLIKGDWAERKFLFLIYILIIESKIYSINKLAEKEGKKNLGWFNGKLSMGWTNDQH